MAKNVRKRGQAIRYASRQLDEHFPVTYKVVGSHDWLLSRFEPGAVLPQEALPIRDVGDLAPVKTWLEKHEYLGGDTETTGGMEAHRPEMKMVMLQLGTPEQVFLIQPELAPEFQGILESKDHLHIFQNAVFDFKILLAKYKIHMERIFDTMLAEQLLTSGLGGYGVGLEDISRRYPPYRLISKEIRKLFIELGDRKFTRKMCYYAARDVALLEPIMLEQVKRIRQYKMEVCCQDEFNVIPVTAGMELYGVHVDAQVLQLALQYWNELEASMAEEIMHLYDEEMAKGGSAKDKGLQLVFQDFHQVFKISSPKGKLDALRNIGIELADTKRDTLQSVEDSRICSLLADYSLVTKITSTYGESLIARIDPATGRLYPSFRQLGAGDEESAQRGRENKSTIATGRYSSDFQQLPKGEKRYARVTDESELEALREHFASKLSELEGELTYA